jgi:integrase
MTPKTLTVASVERLKPTPGKRRIVRDGGSRSLFLVVQPSGHKSWVMRFRRPGGKGAKIHLGPLDLSGHDVSGDPAIGQPLSLVAARRLAAKINSERAQGRDVIADHKAVKHRRRTAIAEASTNSFAAAARAFIEEHAKAKLRSWQETARLLGFRPSDLEPTLGGLAQRWGERDVRSIDPHDLYEVIEEARRLGTPGIAIRSSAPSDSRARHLYASLSSMFSWLQRRRRVAANPMVNLYGPGPAQARDRVLTGAEIGKFWAATDTISEPFGSVLRLLLITGARLDELASLRWEELSETGDALNIPGSRTKNKRPFVIPLPPLAREIIAGISRIEGCPYAFSTNGLTPISGWSKTKRRLDAALGDVPHFRIHDLRRTAATQMAEIGIAPHIVEACLNHISGAKASVAGTYNRAAYAAEKKAALERWAAHLENLTADRPADVVPIKMPRPR